MTCIHRLLGRGESSRKALEVVIHELELLQIIATQLPTSTVIAAPVAEDGNKLLVIFDERY